MTVKGRPSGVVDTCRGRSSSIFFSLFTARNSFLEGYFAGDEALRGFEGEDMQAGEEGGELAVGGG